MKNCVGFDIGNHAVHFAVQSEGNIVRAETVRSAANLVKEGNIVSYEAMEDVLKELRKTYKLPKDAALVMPASLCYCRRFYVAANTRDQLMFNLPYGFKDFISDDKSHYFFDCAILNAVRYGDDRPPEFDVLATAARKDTVEDYIDMFKRAGFKLRTIIPAEFAYTNLLRKAKASPHHHGILDIGHNAVKLYLFDGTLFESVRVIEYGCDALDDIISEKLGVDKYVASTYRENDYNGVNDLEECRNIYSALAIEIVKAVNFYRFNGGVSLKHLHCCGGGAHNKQLMETLREALSIPLADLGEFFEENKAEEEIDFDLVASAAGAALQ